MKTKLLPLILFFLLTTPAYAETASVNINNSVNTSGSNTNSNTKTETHIKIETDGKVTEYNSTEGGSVEVKSINGKSEIKVNGQMVSEHPTTKPEASQGPTAITSPTSKAEKKDSEKQNAIEKFIEKVDDAIEKLFSALR